MQTDRHIITMIENKPAEQAAGADPSQCSSYLRLEAISNRRRCKDILTKRLLTQIIMDVFVEQPLASPGSAN